MRNARSIASQSMSTSDFRSAVAMVILLDAAVTAQCGELNRPLPTGQAVYRESDGGTAQVSLGIASSSSAAEWSAAQSRAPAGPLVPSFVAGGHQSRSICARLFPS